MGSETENEYCKGCLKSEKKMMKLREIWEGNVTFSELFDSLLGTKTFGEIFQFVCEKCKIRLIDAYLFKEQCLVVERIYKDKLMEHENDNHSTFLHIDEIDIKLENENDDSLSENLVEDLELEETKFIEYSTFVSDVDNKTPIMGENVYVQKDYVDDTHKANTNGINEYLNNNDNIKQNQEHCIIADDNPLDKSKNKNRSYICTKCNKKFTRKSSLKRHEITHANIKPFKCDICKKSFTQNGSLKQHILIHSGIKPYKCDICERGFTDKKALVNHNRIHTGEKPFKCDECKLSFRQRQGLKIHNKNKHSLLRLRNIMPNF